ncbi:MAG: glycine--tRNA ligase, partial [Candidatus Aenigmarchaeota archaeon]|nr:glycine--tRNA ligase [Candidatus Aenigmarchaeota archaeon]
EVKTSLGWVEIVANNNRADYDMGGHGKISGKDVTVVNPETNEKLVPHIWEISMGVDRLFYCVMELSYRKDSDHVYLSLPSVVAPFQAMIFPLVNKDGMPEKARQIAAALKEVGFDVDVELKDSIGKRYARADEIGIRFCITIDNETISDNSVTIRDRDTKKQERVKIEELGEKIAP